MIPSPEYQSQKAPNNITTAEDQMKSGSTASFLPVVENPDLVN
jgi:hypothetical protein